MVVAAVDLDTTRLAPGISWTSDRFPMRLARLFTMIFDRSRRA